MLISVRDDDGSECYSYSTNKNANCLFPARAEVPKIAAAMEDALLFLRGLPALKEAEPK